MVEKHPRSRVKQYALHTLHRASTDSLVAPCYPLNAACQFLRLVHAMSAAAAAAVLQFGRKTNAIDVCLHFASEIKGSTVLITGPTKGGIGYATAVDIAQQSPAKLILVGRDLAK